MHIFLNFGILAFYALVAASIVMLVRTLAREGLCGDRCLEVSSPIAAQHTLYDWAVEAPDI